MTKELGSVVVTIDAREGLKNMADLRRDLDVAAERLKTMQERVAVLCEEQHGG